MDIKISSKGTLLVFDTERKNPLVMARTVMKVENWNDTMYKSWISSVSIRYLYLVSIRIPTLFNYRILYYVKIFADNENCVHHLHVKIQEI